MTSDEANLYKEFQETNEVLMDNEAYVPVAAAPDFIRLCEAKNFAVIGADKMRRIGDIVEDLMEMYDGTPDHEAYTFGWERFRSSTNEAATKFVEAEPRGDDIYVVFCLMSQHEWEGGCSRLPKDCN